MQVGGIIKPSKQRENSRKKKAELPARHREEAGGANWKTGNTT